MSTAQPKTLITNRRLIERDDLGARFFDYLEQQTVDHVARVYDSPGVFSPKLSLVAAGNDEFDIDGTSLATDGLGRLLSCSVGGSYCQNVRFQNTSAVAYEVSIKRSLGVNNDDESTQANPNTGVPEYKALVDYIGESGAPDSVSLAGDDIELVVDGLCEAGVSHEGRVALVYLNTPVTSVPAVAVQTLNVAWSGGQNKVTVVSDKLGQSVASTDASKYTVIVLGPTVRRNSSKAGVSGYVVIGSVRGGGAGNPPAGFDTSAQPLISVSLSNINQAFSEFAAARLTTASAGPKESIPAVLWGAGSAVHDDLVYSFGGLSSATDEATATNAAYSYDPGADSWTTLASMPDAANALVSAAALGDLLYVFGGHDGTTTATTARTYDPDADSWSTVTAMPAARHAGALVAMDSALYYIGGQSAKGLSGSASCYKYDPDADSWSGIADMPSGKSRHTAIAYNSKLYVFGGSDTEGSQFAKVEETCFVYDPSEDKWGTLTSHPTAAYSGVEFGGVYLAAGFEHNGVVHFVSGGGSNTTAANLHRAYNIAGDSWAELPMPSAPYTFGSSFGAVDGVLYSFGGRLRDPSSPEGAAATSQGFGLSVETVASSQGVGSVSDIGTAPISVAGSQTLSTITTDRSRFASCQLGRAMFMHGGLDGGGNPQRSAELYWPDTEMRLEVPDTAAARIDHGAVAMNDTHAVVFMGRLDVAPAGIGVDIWEYNIHDNDWTVAETGSSICAYGIATDGNVAFFIGGEDTAGTTQGDVWAWDLIKHEMITDPVGDLDVSFKVSNAVNFGEDLIVAGPDSNIRSMKVRPLGDVGVGANPMGPINGPSLTNGSGQMGIGVWRDYVYIYNPGEQTIERYDPRTRDLIEIVDSTPTRYGAGVYMAHGRMYLFGGSTTLLGDGTDDVTAISILAPVLDEHGNEPTNYTTGKRGSSVGFRNSQTYGAVVHDKHTSADHVRLTAEVNL